MEKICGIYKITNLINNKIYIGQSVDIYTRWAKYKSIKYCHNEHLRNSFLKYGINNFLFEIIEICNEKDLDEEEKYYIQKFNSFEHGYNQTKGGHNNYETKRNYKIVQIDTNNNEIINEFNTYKQITEETNINASVISTLTKIECPIKIKNKVYIFKKVYFKKEI